MTGYELLEAMSTIDERFIEEADSPRRMIPFRRVMAVAAAIAVVFGGALGAWVMAWEKEPVMITEIDGDLEWISACYAAPQEGKVQYEINVRATVENHAGENAVFWMELDVFSSAGAINFSKETAYEECARLEKAGCDIYIRDKDWIGYWGEDKHYTTICGLFTKEQLDAFPVAEHYGYHLKFAEGLPEDYVPFE